MSGLEIRELEAFLAVAEELHFGRAGERMHVSQSRVSQLLRALERRIGAQLVERTSRSVRLTPLGQELLAGLRPAYDTLRDTVDDVRSAARGVRGSLRVGFQGAADDDVVNAVALFQNRHPECATDLAEIPLSDPFGPLYRDEVDAAVVLLPVEEPELVVGPVFSRQPQTLALPTRHPLAKRAALGAEELADVPLIGVDGPAPGYWRQALAPARTPGGLATCGGPRVSTLQEGLTLVAAGRGGMLLCRHTASFYGRRSLAFVPVTGLEDSFLGLVWHRDRENARIRAFSRTLAATATTVAGTRPAAARQPA
ncbi:LysR family transcriptional regulator [Streptomyces sp. HNM0574]|uniref:LysR family transcriptional regulator n=1 Tax=Streptomyces sp. HNM0574 TaxID=2714954 RepID=UPI00146D22FB|nr:LysR family transcriptional regulator [Streptomyces sp. HNM0574]NLU68700.1 LysR family transcriptional regulator [Streptomyces sp. HNM0574]